MKGRILSVCLIFLIVFSSMVLAMEKNWVKSLKLSRDQIEQIKEQRIQTTKENHILQKELLEANQKLRLELLNDKPSFKEVQRLREEIAQIQIKLLRNHIKGMESLRKVLTKEQRELLFKIMEDHKRKIMKHSLFPRLRELDVFVIHNG